MHRKDFLQLALSSATASILFPGVLSAQKSEPGPPLAPERVKEFVGVGHRNLERVQQMFAEEPTLLNAAWDWGRGDFETALGAAGHVGNREIAEFLLSQGARADIFVLTMLGKTAIVKALLAEYPALLNSYGPHGYTLLHHANRGGEAAAELREFLLGQGLKEERLMLFK
jgi:hypothetical protein